MESNWAGHHPAYFVAFVRALLQLGCEVLAICPRPGEIFLGDLASYFEGGSNALLQMVKYDPPKWRLPPGRWRGAIDSCLHDRWLRKTLRVWETQRQRSIDLVFFACLYELSTLPKSFPWKWSGLLLHCRAFRMPGTPVPYTRIVPQPERLLSHPRMTSIATLDEGAVRFLTGLSGGKPTIRFPDFADDSPPARGGVGEKLRQFAASRAVVCCLGHLQPTKGVVTLARVALAIENQDIVFAFVGSLMRGVFAPEDQRLLEVVATRPNVFTHFEHLPTESDFNAVVKACDLLFAAYQDFPHSSNILAKAGLFQKPAIVSDGYLMAERVQRFRLGKVVPEQDASAAARAIREILTDIPSWRLDCQPRWPAYADEHSVARLVPAFEEILASSRAPKNLANHPRRAGGILGSITEMIRYAPF